MALPVSTRWPAALVTVTLLKAGSSFWVNHSVTSRGGGRDLVADARFGMIEKSVRDCFTRHKQQQQRDYYGDS